MWEYCKSFRGRKKTLKSFVLTELFIFLKKERKGRGEGNRVQVCMNTFEFKSGLCV